MILRWFGATVTALALMGCAAEPEDPLNGAWHVQTGLLDNANANYASYMDGTLIVESGEEGQRLCSLSMTQHSYNPVQGMKIGDYASSSMQQSCQIVVSGNAVSIISSVPEGSTWTPDNFELTLEGDQMTGRLVSGSAASALLLRKTDGFTPPPPPEGFAGRETLAGQPQGWREVGTDTKGCKFEYQSPLRVFGDPPSIRVTVRSDCGGTTDEGVPFDRSELNLWYVCNGNVQYAEAEVLFSGEEVVDRWTSTAYGMAADGPTLHEAGIPGSTLQSTAVMRQLYDRFCA